MNKSHAQSTAVSAPLTYASRQLDICGVCHSKYNIGSNQPRILIHCGHTFCQSCLKKYIHSDHILCPSCGKLINNVTKVTQLPLNFPVLGEIIKNDPILMLLLEGQSDTSMYAQCPIHPEKQKHYYCIYHESNYCSECVYPLHRQSKCKVVDLYDIDQIYQQNEADVMKNKMIVKTRSKAKGKMIPEEFFISNA